VGASEGRLEGCRVSDAITLPPFTCRRYEMVFEYTPPDDAPFEAFWTFAIPSQSIAVPFLLAGAVKEPRVMFDRPSLLFGTVQLGVRGKLALALVNDEAVPLHFALDKASYDATPELLALSGGGAPVLEILPDSGIVPAHGQVCATGEFDALVAS
jgi:hypothetical protein